MAPTNDASGQIAFAHGLSAADDAATAASSAASSAMQRLAKPADLAMVFISTPHVQEAASVNKVVREATGARCLLGVSGVGVLAGDREFDDGPGVAVLVASMPGVELEPFAGPEVLDASDDPEKLAKVIHAGPGQKGVILFADAFSVPVGGLLARINDARAKAGVDLRESPLIGGMASAGDEPGANAMMLNDRVFNSGVVGVSFRGPVRIDAVVSQGCKPFGPNFVITKARPNLIQELGGRPAMERIEEAVEDLEQADRKLLAGGLLLGRVVDERKPRFGRGDYLIRHIVGIDKRSGAVAVDDRLRTGQTVRLHLRDRETASSDLLLLMDAQRLHDQPAGALVCTCNARGSALFGRPHHDAMAVARAFQTVEPGERAARGGQPIDAGTPILPTAGFFAAGEIGPIAGLGFLHTQTACIALFRAE